MRPLRIGADRRHLKVMCLGAHSDDIEIGCAATLLRWLGEYERVDVTWCVLSAVGDRRQEARRSAEALLDGAATQKIVLGDFDDAHFPADFRRLKAFIGDLRGQADADVVLTHQLDDRHQDHRLVAELTWQAWRDHLIMEYEIPKYEGSRGEPNLFVPVSEQLAERKVQHLLAHFGSQRSKSWFTRDTFAGLMRLRAIEAGSGAGWAEAFQVRKCVL